MDYKKKQGGGGGPGQQPPWKQNNNQQPQRGGTPYHGKPQRSNVAPTQRSSINLITNNFKIKSKKEKGVIYTYKVDFLEGSGPGGVSGSSTSGSAFEGGHEGSMESAEQISTSMSMMSLSKSQSVQGGGSLETF